MVLYTALRALLAQLVEQLTLNQRVEGSSPSRRTSFFHTPQVCGFLLFCTACVRVRSPAAPMMVLYGIFGVSECELTNINDRSCQ